METDVKKKLERLKIIFNDDMKIIDFLSDLKGRRVITDLQDFIRDSRGLPSCLLHNSRADNIMVLILYKSPFAFNDPENTLMLYAGNNLRELMVYFRNLFEYTSENEHTSENKSVINKALADIVQLLYRECIRVQKDNAPLNFMG